MKVKDLIMYLENLGDPEAEVIIEADNYSDIQTFAPDLECPILTGDKTTDGNNIYAIASIGVNPSCINENL